MQDEGRFSITVRLLLTETQRERLLALCQRERRDVVDAVTQIIGSYLDQREDLTMADVAPQPTSPAEHASLQRHLRELRMHAGQMGPETPPWLRRYIAQLEQELGGKR